MELFSESPALAFLIVFLLFYVVMSWIDANSDKNFFENVLGFQQNSLMTEQVESSSVDDKQTIAELKERVAVLEKIITDNRYELDQKLNQL